jgi:archaemetzincin
VHEKHTIAILPFKDADSLIIKELKKGLQNHLLAEVSVLAETPLPTMAFYKPRQRYIADSLLAFLRRVNGSRFEKIIGLTSKDISTRKGDIANWGILGLGSCPGEACVISTFRGGKNKVSHKIYLIRIITLALHELGHTYGLQHCPVYNCLMKDAEGKMNLDDGDSYCKNCSRFLSEKGLLK